MEDVQKFKGGRNYFVAFLAYSSAEVVLVPFMLYWVILSTFVTVFGIDETGSYKHIEPLLSAITSAQSPWLPSQCCLLRRGV